MAVQSLKIVGSEHKGTKILVIDPDENRANVNETKSELDPRLQRTDIYFVSSLKAGRDAVKKFDCSLVIFPDGLDGGDFVNTQIELLHANPDIQMIPLVNSPSLDRLRSSRSAGGVYDYGDISAFQSYEDLTELIISFIRDEKKNEGSDDELFQFTKILQTCLTLHGEWAVIKGLSAKIANDLIVDFDLSQDEVVKTLAAEQLYLPNISVEDYKTILKPDAYSLLPHLEASGTWEGKVRTPSSTSGLIITASNWLAEASRSGKSVEEILEIIEERPSFLRHTSIRALTEKKVAALMQIKVGKVRHG